MNQLRVKHINFSQKQIGEITRQFGVSRHTVDKLLKNMGWNFENGRIIIEKPKLPAMLGRTE